MRKGLKITGIAIGIFLLVVVLAAALVPVIFKDQLVDMTKKIINDNVKAKVDFKNADVSVFKNFPDITLSLDNITVVGVDKFDGDTLASIESFSASVNIMSFLKNDIIDLKTLSVKSPYIHAIVLKDSTANWDIAISDPNAAQTAQDTSSSSFNMKLDKVEIINGTVLYEDQTMNLFAGVNNLDFALKGNMTAEQTVLDLTTSIKDVNVLYEGTRWIKDASFVMDTKVDADLKNMVFTLKDNDIVFNRIALQANGTISMTGDKQEDILFDLTYGAKVESLNTLLEMIPPSVLEEVKDVKTSGNLALKGWVKGVFAEKSMPSVWVEMKVVDGNIKYSHLPKSVDNLNIDMKALYDGNDDTKTTIDISRFHVEMGGNPFDATASIRTPMTDADIKATMKGKVDFTSLTDALPLKDINLSGILTANVSFAGLMSQIEKEQYESLKLDGTMLLEKFNLKMKDMPMEVQISKTDLHFTPRYVEVKSFDSKIGKTDFQMTGRLENFISYALKDETIKGTLNVTSRNIDCNELMSMSGPETTTTSQDTVPLSVFVLPKNVDFNMTAKVDNIKYDNLDLTNAHGGIGLKNGELLLNNLVVGFADGTMGLSGKYKADDLTKAYTGLTIDMKKVDIASVVKSFDMFQKVLPMLGALSGRMSMNFNFATELDKEMNPVLTSINGLGTIEGDSVKIEKTENLTKITSLVGLKDASHMVKEVKLNFTVKNGKIQIAPFPAKLGDINMMVGGEHGLDQILDYQVDMQVPSQKIAGAANDLLGKIGVKGAGAGLQTINIGIAVGGSVNSPSFKLAAPKYMDSKGVGSQVQDVVKEAVKDKASELLNSLTGGSSASDSTKSETVKDAQEAVSTIKNLFKKKNK